MKLQVYITIILQSLYHIHSFYIYSHEYLFLYIILNRRSYVVRQKELKCKYGYLTSESRASKTPEGTGSEQSSSGTKLCRIFLISVALSIGHTLRNKNPFSMNSETITA